MKTAEQFAVQPHSQGDIYPAVIAVVERYRPAVGELEHASLDARLICRSFALTLDGRTEEYATHDDAEMVARALLADPALRARWSRRGAPTCAHCLIPHGDGAVKLAPREERALARWLEEMNAAPHGRCSRCGHPLTRLEGRDCSHKCASMGGFGDANPGRGTDKGGRRG